MGVGIEQALIINNPWKWVVKLPFSYNKQLDSCFLKETSTLAHVVKW